MPIYEYRCKKCSHEFEALVRNAETKVVCEECGAPVERKLSRFSAKVMNPAAGCSYAQSCPDAGSEHGGGCGCGGCCGGHHH